MLYLEGIKLHKCHHEGKKQKYYTNRYIGSSWLFKSTINWSLNWLDYVINHSWLQGTRVRIIASAAHRLVVGRLYIFPYLNSKDYTDIYFAANWVNINLFLQFSLFSLYDQLLFSIFYKIYYTSLYIYFFYLIKNIYIRVP